MSPIPVKRLLKGTHYATQVWIGDEAARAIASLDPKVAREVVKKIEIFATGGFWKFEGKQGVPIRHEENGAYRVRHKESSLYRIVGFYPRKDDGNDDKRRFIILDAFEKEGPGDKYQPGQWARILEVGRVRASGDWRAVD